MNPATIIFHKNINRYPKLWISWFLKSIKNQAKTTIFEIDYGGTKNQIYKGSVFYSKKFPTHAHAHNFLCIEAVEKGHDCVFNTNIDDIYHYQRVEVQLRYMEAGYDVVSCDMTQINDKNEASSAENAIVVQGKVLRTDIKFSEMDIVKQGLEKNHNIVAHPGVCYSKNFIENSGLLIPEEIPTDDFNLWKRSYAKFDFYIVPYSLLFYRIHSFNISGKNG